MTATVCDALENIDFLMSLGVFDDVRPMLSPVYEYVEMVSNSTKPVVAWATEPHTLEDIYQVAVAVAGSQVTLRKKPVFAYFANYESPLRHGEKQIANMIWAAEHGIPIFYHGGPTVGLESPMTGASALVLHLAAALSGMAIIQLKRRGAAMAIGGLPAAMDLFTARPAYGSPEMFLHTAAAADLARYLRVPFIGTAGASESKVVDAQTGAEISMQILLASLSGAGLVHDVGFLDCADIGSLELLVFADEVISMVKRVMRGITVNQQTIMLDLIEKVGPGGHFLAEKESVSLTRQEIWVPKLLDRNPYMIWEEKGAKTTGQRTYERLQHILANHKPPRLPDNVAQKINGILEAAELREAKG
jgi:trimethylamine--corrinoid protein Co-methyltransferase